MLDEYLTQIGNEEMKEEKKDNPLSKKQQGGFTKSIFFL
jgi:hypothetical protein